MIKRILIAIFLLSLINGNTWDAEASQRTLKQEKIVDFSHRSENRVREKRFLSNPFTSIVNIWHALGHMYQLYVEVS